MQLADAIRSGIVLRGTRFSAVVMHRWSAVAIRFGFVVLGTLLVWLLPAANGQAADERDQPYGIRVVFDWMPHRHFTEPFRRQLVRGVHGNLQAALGKFARVEVIDGHQLPSEQRNAPGELVPYKTHVVRLAFEEDHYRIRMQQIDGYTGLTSGAERVIQTHDRALLQRLIGITLERDFGWVGSFDLNQRVGDRVRLKLFAGNIEGPLDRWLKVGEVFAVARIRTPPTRRPEPFSGKTAAVPAKSGSGNKGVSRNISSGPMGERLEGVLLQLVGPPLNGYCECRILSRYQDPFSGGRALEYRCLKLGTTTAVVQVQLLAPNGEPLVSPNLRVRFQRNFGDNTVPTTVGNRESIFTSPEPMTHLACVQVQFGERVLGRVPLDVQEGRIVPLTFRLDANADKLIELTRLRQDSLARVIEARLIQSRCLEELKILTQQAKNEEALQRVRSAYKAVESERDLIRERIAQLKQRIATDKLPNTDDYARDAEFNFQQLQEQQNKLAEYIAELDKAIAQANDPNRKKENDELEQQLRQARLLAKQGSYDEAIAAYDALLAKKEQPQVRAERDQLFAQWQPRDAEHANARKFLLDVWLKSTQVDDIRKRLKEAKAAIAKCQQVGDRLTINRVLVLAPELNSILEAEIKRLENAENDEDKLAHDETTKLAKEISKLFEELDQFRRAKN